MAKSNPQAKPPKRKLEPPAVASPPATTPKAPPPTLAKITEPGRYPDISLDAYHGDLCDGLSVSASTLVTLHRSCAAKAWAHHYGNPEQIEDEDTPDKAFGSAAHCLILEGEDVFFRHYTMKPAGMNFTTTEGKAWRLANGGREFVREEDLDAIRAMARALATHPKAGWAFSDGQPELTLVAKDPETGIWLKARPDYLRPTLGLNYKTARDASGDKWQRQALNLFYHVAAALSIDVAAQIGEKINYAFVIQEKKPPYLPAVRVLADDFIEGGRMIYRRALRQFADCAAKGQWPGYDDIETVPWPAWAERQLANTESPL